MAKGKNDLDKFLSQNLDKAVQTVPQPGDDGVGPVAADPNAGMIEMVLAAQKANEPTLAVAEPPPEVKIPDGLTDVQKELVRSVVDSRARVGPMQQVKIEEPRPAAWNPYQQFHNRPVNTDNLAAHVSGASLGEIKPKEGVNPLLVEAYSLLRTLVAGGWITPGLRLTEAELLVRKLKTEVEG